MLKSVSRSAFVAAMALAFTATFTTAFTTAQAMTPLGAPVKKIPFADQIKDWHALDNQRLVVTVSSKRNYLVTLEQECPRLRSAQNIGVSMSNNTIWAGFDAVTADGWRCSIGSINKVTRKQVNAL